MFTVIPAVDILDGKCVRLLRGEYGKVTKYADDPVEMATRWAETGAKWLHVVDLNGAKSGMPENLEIIREIINSLHINVEVGGGIRDLETIKFLVDAGAKRIVIGTKSVQDVKFIKDIVEKYGEKIVIGVDAKEGFVATDGWTVVSNKKTESFIAELKKLGVKRIIFTDISRDGAMTGPNFEAIENLAGSIGIPLIASGGITSISDIKDLKDIENVEGCIVGRALYDGKISLEEALKL
ncbi:1-(5-phosphoribosyl)-5-[(5-phosphoribosylamino)methylideneamino]imidazole-4-carboxamide isomerase [Candidatus Margulisiibacteriota bacterium]